MADLIAAGEVVERPASVSKELIENAIDAGAHSITVEMENGGVTYLRVTDDGCGMVPEDAKLAFHRHATSKIREESDLSAISTLGFRGEALAAISSVSRIDLFTKTQGEVSGTHLNLEAGEIIAQEEAGCPEGTSFVIRDLFYNMPARMKFLKKDFTEAGYVLDTVQHAALSHPEIAFKCIRDGKIIFSTPGTGELSGAIYGVFGKELSSVMLEIKEREQNGVRVWGYVSKPHAARANRSMQHFFVNGRYVKSRIMQAALEQAYRNSIITGKYPFGCVNISLPLSQVDVNVHPAKTEVKFSLEKQVFDAIYVACKNTIAEDENAPEIRLEKAPKEDNLTQEQQKMHVSAPHKGEAKQDSEVPPALLRTMKSAGVLHQGAGPAFQTSGGGRTGLRQGFIIPRTEPIKEVEPILSELIPRARGGRAVPPSLGKLLLESLSPQNANEKGAEALQAKEAVAEEKEVKSAQMAQQESEHTGFMQENAISDVEARVLGQCFGTYIVAEDEKGLLLIDKHAAHERIIFNKLKKTAEIPTQMLLSPVVADFSAAEYSALLDGLDKVRALGFDTEPFGEKSMITRQAPAYLDAADIPATLSELAAKISDHRSAQPDKLDDLIHMVSCKAAIKGSTESSELELSELLRQVLSDPEVTCCPHGRPVMVRLTKYELDKLFKRVDQ